MKRREFLRLFVGIVVVPFVPAVALASPVLTGVDPGRGDSTTMIIEISIIKPAPVREVDVELKIGGHKIKEVDGGFMLQIDEEEK